MHRISHAAAIATLTALTACEQASPPQAAPPEPAQPANKAPAAPDVLAEILWPPAEKIDHAVLSALPAAAADAVRTAPVPVLVPARPAALLTAPVIVVKEHWYSFWGKAPGITVSVQGTRLAKRHPGIEPVRGPHTVRGVPGFVTQNEGIWSATWMEHGVTYTLDLECASPADPPCASDAALLSVAADLAYVGGNVGGGAK